MLGDRRLFDDMARVASGAAGAFGGIRSRMEGELRDHVERLLARMNLVTREDYEVVAALARTARAEQEVLAERVAALEAKLVRQPRPAKRAAAVAAAETDIKPKTPPARRRRGEPR
jgi:BMFP domain-containing protein YqiC